MHSGRGKILALNNYNELNTNESKLFSGKDSFALDYLMLVRVFIDACKSFPDFF